MLKTRFLVAALLLPIGLAAIYFGGFPYYALVSFFLVIAAYEYVRMFRAGGLRPAGVLVMGGVLLFVFGRIFYDFDNAPLMLTAVLLASIVYHLFAFERGCQQSGTDYGVTLAGILYLGWIGAYLISLRKLPLGEWWMLLVLPSIWMVDSGAYLVGSRFGRHKLSPRLSPRKTWEGYFGGVVAGILGGALLAAVWQSLVAPGSLITLERGAVLGLALGLLTIFGDLGESMFKRQFGLKDSGNILPGHGGAFDRIDSWLWGGVIGYYVIVFFTHYT